MSFFPEGLSHDTRTAWNGGRNYSPMVATMTTKTMELEGNLKAFQLSDILRFLAMGKMSGVLTAVGRERTIELLIKDGAVVGAGSGDRFPRLGQMLVYNGLISRKSLDEVLEYQRENSRGKMLGEILIERGLVTQDKLDEVLNIQIREEIWDLFSWTDGIFKFEHGIKPAMERSKISLEIEPLIEEGSHHMEQWQAIAGNLSDPDQVYRVSPELAVLPEAHLNEATWRVLSLINGRHSIQVLNFLSGLGRFDTLRALDRLVTLQLVEPLPRRSRAGGPGRLNESQAAAQAADGSERAAAPETITENTEEEPSRRGLFGMRRRAARTQPFETPPPPG